MLTDAELVDGVVAGYDDAFAQLYERHSSAAWRLGQTVTGNADDAADAVAEAFARVLVAVRAGHLDNGGSFRSYLLTATRNAALDNIRKTGRARPTEQEKLSQLESNAPTPSDRLTGDEEAAQIAEAFRNLPERWRSVLWLTEVEGVATKDAASRLGLSANGAAQLAVRARTGLRERFLQAHLRNTVDPGCRATVNRLGAYVGGGLAPRDLAKVDQHLAGCSPCQSRKDELDDVRTSLRRAALPVPLALGGAMGAAMSPSVVGGGALAKLLAWAGPAWAQKLAAMAAAGALAVGAGGAYMAGTGDDGTTEVVPTVAAIAGDARETASAVPPGDAGPVSSAAAPLGRAAPPPAPAAVTDGQSQGSQEVTCPDSPAGEESLLGSARVAGESGAVAVDADAERSALIGDVTVEGPPEHEDRSMSFGALLSNGGGGQAAADTGSGDDRRLDLDLGLGDVELGLGFGSGTADGETTGAASDRAAQCAGGEAGTAEVAAGEPGVDLQVR